MKKILIFGAVATMIIAFGSCKPKQSAYKAAYEQAKEREMKANEANDEYEEEIVPISKPSTSAETEEIRQERITPVMSEEAPGLKKYSVVIGSFKNSTNASSLRDRMRLDGYNAILARNEQGMLRVIVTSFDDKARAIQSRDALKYKYAPNFQDAWILERQF